MKAIEKDTVQNFVVSVKSQENHTWQGTVSWIEGKKQVNFRSALELLKLMDSAMEKEEENK